MISNCFHEETQGKLMISGTGATVTSFDGEIIQISHSAEPQVGWDVYLDGIRLTTKIQYRGAGQSAVYLGCTVDLAETSDLRVRYAGSERLVDVHPDLLGFINSDQSRLPLSITTGGLMPLGPILRNLQGLPLSDEMIRHVSGNTDHSGYFMVGHACALDMLRFGVLNSPTNKVFDIGCGCGRVGQFIASMLDPTQGGCYTGYDTWGTGIDWADANITALLPQARFVTLGKIGGYEAATSFTLDLPPASQDAFVATSLFTHLRKPAAEGYFAEIARLLKPGGRAYITYFASKTLITAPADQYEEDDYAINIFKEGSEDTYVDEAQISMMAERHGLSVLGRKYGFWRGQKYRYRQASGFQDVFIFKRV
jgi:SAM-dependent methyltransferase